MDHSITIANINIRPGERLRFRLPMAKLYDHTELGIPIEVINGRKKGPILLLTAALHGDEINGVEIIRKIVANKSLAQLKGTLICLPTVNVYGFNNKSRYLPDRRDLNRLFPGTKNGSMGSRIAHTLMKEVISQCTHGIDLHTGAKDRSNLPQIRGMIDDSATLKLAKTFGAPVIVNADVRDGSLREAATELGIPFLLYEAGEALRFDDASIRLGTNGILNVMRSIGMLPKKSAKSKPTKKKAFITKKSFWIRAPQSGILTTKKKLGTVVNIGDTLGTISDTFGKNKEIVQAKIKGVIIGKTQIPLVNKGDALFHVATFKDNDPIFDYMEENDFDIDFL